MSSVEQGSLMDHVYRHQRHIYDLTRKYYLLGRDRMIAEIEPPKGGTVLELGCGTGRNLILAARRYPGTRFYGIDISNEMLATARHSVAREGLAHRIVLARGDATDFDAGALFCIAKFDRVFISYALSMIPDWRRTLAGGFGALGPQGSLHVADFGGQEGLPGWFRTALRGWLAKFHVEPRAALEAELRKYAAAHRASLRLSRPYRGYAIVAAAKLAA